MIRRCIYKTGLQSTTSSTSQKYKYKYKYQKGNNLPRLAEHNKLNFIETSAAEALNVEWAFEAVIRFGQFYILPSIILYNFTSFIK